MKRFCTVLLLLCAFILGAGAQGFEADSLETAPEPSLINDYILIGVNYGVSFANMYYSPARNNRAFVTSPNYVSVTFTKFSKMFDKLPYFALVIGAAHGYEGFAFEKNPETGYTQDLDGAEQATIEVFEIPAFAQIHADFHPGKIMANVGVYAGWRNSISRSGPNLDPAYANAFRPYEHRFDYGLQGGAGFALMFDPIEIHLNALVRWSWSSLYDPDYASPYYYRYAYPMDAIVTLGVHFQLTKRSGKTSQALRQEAKAIVYGTY
ncbi:MAG: hypothetical protein GXY24_03495 [Bacteroidales bacterium]|jgi:hypothetical protein|nr:hypothetical protein [Bacteroidales bacterium]